MDKLITNDLGGSAVSDFGKQDEDDAAVKHKAQCLLVAVAGEDDSLIKYQRFKVVISQHRGENRY